MIKLSYINKYYNKKKSNQIHVINDISLELPDKGLVAFLGNSGCGKTTLLNVIGGLDKPDKGTVQIDNTIIETYKPSQWDNLRSRKIGYVFQNYFLFYDKSVYENLEMVLNLAGLYDKKLIDERINYALSLVGLSKYKKRKPATLSGGQQQRVGIARALVKSPTLIIADEPTGNLDSRNTFEIMDILKSISKYCLVVLVTHEQNIAQFFADRIIELEDGKISRDYINESEQGLDNKETNHIYLGDMNKSSAKALDKIDIEYFFNHKPIYDIKIQVIEVEGRIYIKSDNDYNIPVSLIDKDSEIKLHNEAYKQLNKQEHQSIELDRNILSPIMSAKKGSVIKTSISIRNAITKYYRTPLKKKLISHMLLFATAIMLVLSLSLAATPMVYDDSAYRFDQRAVVVNSSTKTMEDFINNSSEYNYECITMQITPLSVMNINKPSNNIFWQRKQLESIYGMIITMYPYSSKNFNSSLIAGDKQIPDRGEIVISSRAMDNVYYSNKGIDMSYYVGEIVRFSRPAQEEGEEAILMEFKVVGIVESNLMGAWIADEDHNEIIENRKHSKDFSIITSDKETIKNKLKADGYENVTDPYQEELATFNSNKLAIKVFVAVMLSIALILILIIVQKIVKAGYIERIKEIGTYRCIGASKLDTIKQFIFEGIILTTCSSFVGYILASLFVNKLGGVMSEMTFGTFNFFYPCWLMVVTLILIYGINLSLYALRLSRLMRQTPATIMTRYDI